MSITDTRIGLGWNPPQVQRRGGCRSVQDLNFVGSEAAPSDRQLRHLRFSPDVIVQKAQEVSPTFQTPSIPRDLHSYRFGTHWPRCRVGSGDWVRRCVSFHRASNGLVHLTTVTGANGGRGSRIAFRDSDAGRLSDAPCASTQDTGPENDVTGERAPLQSMWPTPTYLTALHQREHEQGVSSNAQDENVGHGVPGFASTDERSGVQDRREREDQGTIVKRPKTPLEYASEDEPTGEGKGTWGAVQPEEPGGESRSPILRQFALVDVRSHRKR